jgi:hypothetical protein
MPKKLFSLSLRSQPLLAHRTSEEGGLDWVHRPSCALLYLLVGSAGWHADIEKRTHTERESESQ